MTNRFYTETWTAAAGSQARSRQPDTQFALIQAAFDLLQAELDNIQAQGGDITDLGKFPATLTGHGLKLLRVNAAATSIEFIAPGNVTIKSIGGTAYTLVAADAGALLLFTNDNPVTVTVPDDVFAQGDVICINQFGDGRVTLSAGAGVTLLSSDNLLATRKQYAQIALAAAAVDQFLVIGERNAPGLDYAVLNGGNQFTGTQAVAFVTLTDGATITIDGSLSNNFIVTLAGNRTLANPTSMRDGAYYNVWVKQDGTGSRTIALGSKFITPANETITLSTGANALDILTFQYNAALDVAALVAIKNFS